MTSHRSDWFFAGLAIILLAIFFGFFAYLESLPSDQDNNIGQLESRLDALEAQGREIQHQIDQRDQQVAEQLQAILDVLEEMPKPEQFQPWPVPLEPELQAHTYMRSAQTGIPLDLIYAIMWTESGMQWHEPVMDSNGYYSVGYCMINGVNWSWLEELGIDVHTPEGNIDGCVYILWTYREKGYSEDQMVAAYNAGEAGMLRGGGVRYLNTVAEARPWQTGE